MVCVIMVKLMPTCVTVPLTIMGYIQLKPSQRVLIPIHIHLVAGHGGVYYTHSFYEYLQVTSVKIDAIFSTYRMTLEHVHALMHSCTHTLTHSRTLSHSHTHPDCVECQTLLTDKLQAPQWEHTRTLGTVVRVRV